MLLLVSTKASPVAQSSDSKGSSFDSCIGEPSCSSVLVVESLHFACELEVMVLRLQTLECIRAQLQPGAAGTGHTGELILEAEPC